MASSNKPAPTFKPLYQQVQELITVRIIEGVWKPGEMLPSEFQLADLLGVSQGTVRKALNALTEDNVLFRRQGVGTFVSEHTLQKMLFHFFHFKSDNGDVAAELPNAKLIATRLIHPSDAIRQILELENDDQVIEIHRVRFVQDASSIRELIYLPARYFADLEQVEKLPHSLYNYYQQQFNITIHKATDSIKAVLSTEQDKDVLNVELGQPLLEVARTAKSLDGRIVEYRLSRANTENLHYLVELN